MTAKSGGIVYFSHGGGPLPVIGGPGHEKMIAFMNRLPSILPRPDRILVISAHWEESLPTVIGNPSPELFYDYYGFPKEAYELSYPAPGSPELAREIQGMLAEHDIESEQTMSRGLDHGVFIPLTIMYPEADIPTTQISLIKGLDAGEHLRLGNALRPLARENTLIIGSGFSFHNMREFAFDGKEEEDRTNDQFQDWLIDVCAGSPGNGEREALLAEWNTAPGARHCHPREEHLLPLHVCVGAAGTAAEVVFDDYILGKRALAFRW